MSLCKPSGENSRMLEAVPAPCTIEVTQARAREHALVIAIE